MVMGFTYGLMVIDTKDSGRCVSNMARGPIVLQMVMFTLVNMLMENHMARESMSGRLVRSTLAIL